MIYELDSKTLEFREVSYHLNFVPKRAIESSLINSCFLDSEQTILFAELKYLMAKSAID